MDKSKCKLLSLDNDNDAGAYAQGRREGHQGYGDQDQGAIQALFSFTSSRVCTVLGNQFGDVTQVMIGRVLLYWTP